MGPTARTVAKVREAGFDADTVANVRDKPALQAAAAGRILWCDEASRSSAVIATRPSIQAALRASSGDFLHYIFDDFWRRRQLTASHWQKVLRTRMRL